jgi:site-specific recombinase XerD
MRNLVPAELRRLLAAISFRSPFGQRDHAMLRLSYFCGLRVGELVGLDVGHVWSVGQPKSELELPAALCKTARSRRIPVEAPAQMAILELYGFLQMRGFSVAASAPLLTDRRHQRLSTREAQRAVQKYREKAGLEWRATPHSLRHAFASELISQGTALPVVQQLLGHRRLTSTEVYLHCQPAELRAAVAKLEL